MNKQTDRIIRTLVQMVVFLSVVGLFVQPARAQQLSPAFSGLIAKASDATTVFWNPAGMTRLKKTELVGILSVAYSVADFEVKPGTTETGGNPKNEADVFLIPSVYFSKPVNNKFYWGLSLNVPSGIGTDYGDTWAGRYITQESSLVFVAFSPAAAYRINDRLSLGGGISFKYVNSESKSAVRNPVPPDGEVELEVDGVGIGVNLGVLYEVSPRTRLGLTYRSETDPDLEGTPELTNVTVPLPPIPEIQAGFRTPQVLQAGLYHEFNNELSLMLDAMWIDFSKFGLEQVTVGPATVSVSSRYKDMWGGSIGARYELSEKWATAFGAMYLSGGVDDENRTLALPFDDIYGFGFGVERTITEKRRLHVNLNYYISGEAPIDTEPTPLSGRVVGEFTDRYTAMVDIGYVWKF